MLLFGFTGVLPAYLPFFLSFFLSFFLLPSLFSPPSSFLSSLPLRSLSLLSQAVCGMIANKKGDGRLNIEIELA